MLPEVPAWSRVRPAEEARPRALSQPERAPVNPLAYCWRELAGHLQARIPHSPERERRLLRLARLLREPGLRRPGAA